MFINNNENIFENIMINYEICTTSRTINCYPTVDVTVTQPGVECLRVKTCRSIFQYPAVRINNNNRYVMVTRGDIRAFMGHLLPMPSCSVGWRDIKLIKVVFYGFIKRAVWRLCRPLGRQRQCTVVHLCESHTNALLFCLSCPETVLDSSLLTINNFH